MSLNLSYKNNWGEVVIHGAGRGAVRLCGAEGLGITSNEYTAAVYTGQNGQHTLSARALPRSITLLLEIAGDNASAELKNSLRILSNAGTLYIENDDISRCIFCSQVQIPEIERVLKGRIFTFAVQFVCDNPYFEDKEDIICPLYARHKRLSTPFTMPCVFSEIITGAQLENNGDIETEPRVAIYYQNAIENAENVTITNHTTGKSICLDYAPQEGDVVVIDVKNRSITSSKAGNLLNYISADTFLGDFILVRGINNISVRLGDVTSGFTVECRYRNLYREALII